MFHWFFGRDSIVWLLGTWMYFPQPVHFIPAFSSCKWFIFTVSALIPTVSVSVTFVRPLTRTAPSKSALLVLVIAMVWMSFILFTRWSFAVMMTSTLWIRPTGAFPSPTSVIVIITISAFLPPWFGVKTRASILVSVAVSVSIAMIPRPVPFSFPLIRSISVWLPSFPCIWLVALPWLFHRLYLSFLASRGFHHAIFPLLGRNINATRALKVGSWSYDQLPRWWTHYEILLRIRSISVCGLVFEVGGKARGRMQTLSLLVINLGRRLDRIHGLIELWNIKETVGVPLVAWIKCPQVAARAISSVALLARFRF